VRLLGGQCGYEGQATTGPQTRAIVRLRDGTIHVDPDSHPPIGEVEGPDAGLGQAYSKVSGPTLSSSGSPVTPIDMLLLSKDDVLNQWTTEAHLKPDEEKGSRGWQIEMGLVGPSGEAIDLWRTLTSHGLTELPPMAIDPDRRLMQAALPVENGRPRIVEISAGRPGTLRLAVKGRRPNKAAQAHLRSIARHMLRLDDDLGAFYTEVEGDPDLSWVTRGAGRLVRSPTVFEDVIKTICTTNCAWSATERMIGALCAHLGERAVGAPAEGAFGRTFPTPEAMAQADDAFYRDVARAGYRGAYMRAIAQAVVAGEIDLESLGRASPEEVPDDTVAERLLELPGVGPYAAAHIMLVLGRTSRLILDSWTRPKYARLVGREKVSDKAIERRFRKYGHYRGLAFWLFLTRDWVED